jgi:hypothetical protein
LRKIAIPLATIAVATAVALLIFEIFLRAIGYSAPVWREPHPQLGWTLRPEASGWFSAEGRSYVQISPTGRRDREHALAKPPATYRIVVLGDAYSEAMQVPLEKAYWAQLPARLAACGFQPGKRIEVLNFGVRDYGTAQQLLVLEGDAIRYRPDLVLLQISHGNDLRDNSRALDVVGGRPYFTLDENGALRLDDSFLSGARYRGWASAPRQALRELADCFRAGQLARSMVRQLTAVQTAHADSGENPAGLEVGALTPPRDARWQEAWRITEALIASMQELASRNGAHLAVVTVPFAMQVHPAARRREALQSELGVADFAYPERRFAAFAERQGALAVTLWPEMQALALANGSTLYGFDNAEPGSGHWNDLGHQAAADIIARQLCAAGPPAKTPA